MLEFCALGAMDSILKELDRGLDEEAIKIITKQTLEVKHFTCEMLTVILVKEVMSNVTYSVKTN